MRLSKRNGRTRSEIPPQIHKSTSSLRVHDPFKEASENPDPRKDHISMSSTNYPGTKSQSRFRVTTKISNISLNPDSKNVTMDLFSPNTSKLNFNPCHNPLQSTPPQPHPKKITKFNLSSTQTISRKSRLLSPQPSKRIQKPNTTMTTINPTNTIRRKSIDLHGQDPNMP